MMDLQPGLWASWQWAGRSGPSGEGSLTFRPCRPAHLCAGQNPLWFPYLPVIAGTCVLSQACRNSVSNHFIHRVKRKVQLPFIPVLEVT